MLDKNQILENKNNFIDLLKRNITRQGALVDSLIEKLENSDFFTAPASTQYHCAYEGGLVQHCLNVYDQLKKLTEIEFPMMKVEGENTVEFKSTCPYSLETVTIVALLHDLAKMNFYETSLRNVKDENGSWKQVPFIKVREAEDRFVYAGHGVNSEFMVGKFIPLTTEESAAIINHMGWSDNQFVGYTISEVFNRYSLAALLHTADVLATFIDEKI